MKFWPLKHHPYMTDARFSDSLKMNQELLQQIWNHCGDFASKVLEIHSTQIGIFALTTLTTEQFVSQVVIDPLHTSQARPKSLDDIAASIGAPSLKRGRTFHDANIALADGCVLIFMDGSNECLIINLAAVKSRAIDKPNFEPSILGPQEAFVEDVNTNLGLLRRRLKSPRFKQEEVRVGSLTVSIVEVLYVEGVTKDAILEEVRTRLNRLEIDGVLDSHMLTELIGDVPRTIFPTIQTTERPDRVASAVLQGRIAILVDGSPLAIVAPTTLFTLLEAPDDYYASYLAVVPARILRHIAFWLSLILPSFYIAVLNFHYEMIPTRLLLTLQQSHEGIPFPTVFEALLMEFIFEILREAGIRMPKAIGQSVSIVGTLIIGEAAVQAGIVSPGMVIVVATTGICSFSIPTYNLTFAMRVLRFPLMVFAASFGLYGIGVYLLGLFVHLTSMRSFGVPYLAPIVPFELGDVKDIILRTPWWNMNRRPKVFEPESVVRGHNRMPSPKR